MSMMDSPVMEKDVNGVELSVISGWNAGFYYLLCEGIGALTITENLDC